MKTDYKEMAWNTLKGIAAVALCFVIFLFTPFMTWFGYPKPDFDTALAITLGTIVVTLLVFLITEPLNRVFKGDDS